MHVILERERDKGATQQGQRGKRIGTIKQNKCQSCIYKININGKQKQARK